MTQKILIIGGTGYIGRDLTEKLISQKKDITLLVRNGERKFTGCKIIVADLLEKESLMKAVGDFDLVINLASIIRTLDKRKYEENTRGIKNLIEVMRVKKINRLIYFSTQNVNLKEKGPYAKSKEASESLLRSSGLSYVIVRPNLVYGIDRFNDFFKMTRIMKMYRLIPIISSGSQRIQPVLKDDLINIVVSLADNFKGNSIVEISGEDTFSICDITNMTSEFLGIKAVEIHMPLFIAKLFKFLFQFDVDGYTEDRVSADPYRAYKFSSFKDNLKKIVELAR